MDFKAVLPSPSEGSVLGPTFEEASVSPLAAIASVAEEVAFVKVALAFAITWNPQ